MLHEACNAYVSYMYVHNLMEEWVDGCLEGWVERGGDRVCALGQEQSVQSTLSTVSLSHREISGKQ